MRYGGTNFRSDDEEVGSEYKLLKGKFDSEVEKLQKQCHHKRLFMFECGRVREKTKDGKKSILSHREFYRCSNCKKEIKYFDKLLNKWVVI